MSLYLRMHDVLRTHTRKYVAQDALYVLQHYVFGHLVCRFLKVQQVNTERPRAQPAVEAGACRMTGEMFLLTATFMERPHSQRLLFTTFASAVPRSETAFSPPEPRFTDDVPAYDRLLVMMYLL